MTTDTAPSARVAIFNWLQRKYVQNQDARQKALGLVYMTAETHDLAEEIERQVAPLDAEIARLQAQAQEDVQQRVDLAAALDSKDAEIRHLRATVLSVAEHRDQLFADKTRLQAQVDALTGHISHLIAAIEFGSKGVRDDAIACARSALAVGGR